MTETIKKQISEIGLKSMLKRHEGFSSEPYRDNRGNWTIGHGHYMKDGLLNISRRVADALLEDDIHKAAFEYLALSWSLDPARQEVVIELIFWHGFKGFLGFKKCVAAIERKDWGVASDELMDSDSGRRYTTRMSELAKIMKGE